MTKRGRYYVHDKAKSQHAALATFNHMNPRFLVIDRETEEVVDEATTAYVARQIVKNLNQG